MSTEKKILFIENRFKTYLWSNLSSHLEKHGWECHFLIQNHYFKPKKNRVHVIKYPKNISTSCLVDDPFFDKLRKQDRIYNYFNGGDLHYDYYLKEIENTIDKITPDIVIGESTLFHELITIELCKRKEILYIHPCTCRYPENRFSFYLYDTLTPYNENLDINITEFDIAIEEKIINRSIKPDYMKMGSGIKDKINSIKIKNTYKAASLISRIGGETFNTPSFLKKNTKDLTGVILKKKWDKFAINVNEIQNWDKAIIVPLQLQPEANLDVWGYPYNDQLENIKKIIDNSPKEWTVLVKPNPKAKYELSEELLNYVKNNDRIHITKHNEPMEKIFSNAKYFFSATGSICIEAAVSNKINLSKKMHLINLFSESYQIDNGLRGYIWKKPRGYLVAYLRSNSYSGLISDPVSSPTSIKEDNIKMIAKAFLNTFDNT